MQVFCQSYLAAVFLFLTIYPHASEGFPAQRHSWRWLDFSCCGPNRKPPFPHWLTGISLLLQRLHDSKLQKNGSALIFQPQCCISGAAVGSGEHTGICLSHHSCFPRNNSQLSPLTCWRWGDCSHKFSIFSTDTWLHSDLCKPLWQLWAALELPWLQQRWRATMRGALPAVPLCC